MEKEYYIPDIEDIHVGYECEIKVPLFEEAEWLSPEYTKGVVTKIFPKFEWTDFRNIPHTFGSNLELDIRAQYLSKEQIENEGWKEISIEGYISKAFNKNGMILTPFLGYIEGKIWSIRITIFDLYLGELFTGDCPSINELRTICKLLNI